MMPCAQCGFILTAFDTVCPRCQLTVGQPAVPSLPQALQQSQQIQNALNAPALGVCPQCQSGEIVQFDNYETHNAAWNYMASGCLVGLLGLPAILLFGIGFLMIFAGIVLFCIGLFAGTRRKIATSRHCNGCGYRWLV